MRHIARTLMALPFPTLMTVLMAHGTINLSAFIFGPILVLCILTSIGKYAEYRKASRLLKNGWSTKVAEKLQFSWCQRCALLQAARENGCLSQAEAYLYQQGYRMWHILPDFSGSCSYSKTQKSA